MGIPEELKQVAIDRRSMEQEVWSKQHKYDYERKYGRKRHTHSVEAFNWAYQDMAKIHNRIQELKQNIEENKVREQGLVDRWNAEKIALEVRLERKRQARGGHPEAGLSPTYKPPARRSKSGARSRYQPPKRRSTPRPRKTYRPPSGRR